MEELTSLSLSFCFCFFVSFGFRTERTSWVGVWVKVGGDEELRREKLGKHRRGSGYQRGPLRSPKGCFVFFLCLAKLPTNQPHYHMQLTRKDKSCFNFDSS
ncbi:unnamed protein product [Prunus brigantina]